MQRQTYKDKHEQNKKETVSLQAWLAAKHSLEETQAEMARLQDLADAVMNIAEPKVTFRLIQVCTSCIKHGTTVAKHHIMMCITQAFVLLLVDSPQLAELDHMSRSEYGLSCRLAYNMIQQQDLSRVSLSVSHVLCDRWIAAVQKPASFKQQ